MSTASDAQMDAQIDETCHAMVQIRDRKLYRETNNSFEDYILDTFGPKHLALLAAWEENRNPKSKLSVDAKRLNLLVAIINLHAKPRRKRKPKTA